MFRSRGRQHAINSHHIGPFQRKMRPDGTGDLGSKRLANGNENFYFVCIGCPKEATVCLSSAGELVSTKISGELSNYHQPSSWAQS